MKNLIVIISVLFLSACATNVKLTDTQSGATKGQGLLQMAFLTDGSLQIQLDGQNYQGTWTPRECENEPCKVDQRMNPETNYHTSHGRHTMLGKAVLSAPNGSTLDCKWRKHQQTVQGSCSNSEGKTFTLSQATQ